MYHKLHEFMELEILDESIDNILTRFQLIDFIKKRNFIDKRSFCIINAFDKRMYKSYDLLYSKNLELINKNLFLFNLLSSKFKLKCVAEIKI